MQLPKMCTLVAVSDIASTACNKPGKQKDFKSSTATSSEFAPLLLEYIQLKARKKINFHVINRKVNLFVCHQIYIPRYFTDYRRTAYYRQGVPKVFIF